MDEKARESNRLRQKKYLDAHREEVNEKRRQRYQERITSGTCPRCGGRVKKGRTLCTNCREYILDLNRKYAKRNKAQSAAKPLAKLTVKQAAKASAKPARPAKKAAVAKTQKRKAK